MQLPFGNYYLVNAKEGWASICISKNGCTSLKASVLRDAGRPVPRTVLEVHDSVGYTVSEFLRPAELGPPAGLHTFAVWRDPVDRWYSALAYLRTPEEHRARREIVGRVNSLKLRLSLRQAAAVTASMLAKSPTYCDEHLRRQGDYCDFASLDTVLELKDLDAWFAAQGWQPLPRLNEGTAKLARDESISNLIGELYAADYALRPRDSQR